MQNKIISLIPSEDLKAEIKRVGHLFSDEELARIIIDCAPTVHDVGVMLEEFSAFVKDPSFSEYIRRLGIEKQQKDAFEREPGCQGRCLNGEVCINHLNVKYPVIAGRGEVVSYPDAKGHLRMGVVLYDYGAVCEDYCIVPTDSEAVSEHRYENEFASLNYVFPPHAEKVEQSCIDSKTLDDIAAFMEFWNSLRGTN